MRGEGGWDTTLLLHSFSILDFVGAEIFFSPVKWPLLAAGHPETGPLVWTGLWSALYWTAAPDHTTRKSKRLWSPKTLCFCRIVYILYYFPWSSLAACQLQGCIFHLHFGLFFCIRFYIFYILRQLRYGRSLYFRLLQFTFTQKWKLILVLYTVFGVKPSLNSIWNERVLLKL